MAFVINRSTDFFWEAEAFSPLREAYLEGKVYVAPNPFTYATRSDKRLLEFLSLPNWDQKLGILPDERTVLARMYRQRISYERKTSTRSPRIKPLSSSNLCMALPVTACSPVRRWARGACANC